MKKYKITLTYEIEAPSFPSALGDAFDVINDANFQHVDEALLTVSDGQETHTYDAEFGYEVKNA